MQLRTNSQSQLGFGLWLLGRRRRRLSKGQWKLDDGERYKPANRARASERVAALVWFLDLIMDRAARRATSDNKESRPPLHVHARIPSWTKKEDPLLTTIAFTASFDAPQVRRPAAHWNCRTIRKREDGVSRSMYCRLTFIASESLIHAYIFT